MCNNRNQLLQVVNKYKHQPKSNEVIVYIGRGSALGNPFVIGKHGNRAEVINQYNEYIREVIEDSNSPQFKELIRIYELMKEGKFVRLQCFCKPHACHGDIIVDLISGVE